MATAPFASLEARMTSAVFARLSNVVATVDGVQMGGIFDAEHQLGTFGLAGIAAAQPMLQIPTASVPASPVGKVAMIGSTTYTIVEHQPQSGGRSVLMLERA
jgi:hypothetical protein